MANPAYELPQPRLPLIGREAELEQLTYLLAQPACRLLTLIGAGGVGKTRLALELSFRQQTQFADGVCFVALQPLASVADLLPAIAAAAGCPVAGSADLASHLQAFLRDRQMLLVLDNFEHLIEGAGLLPDLSMAAAELKLLVTSREALNVQAEWRYTLGGLAVPQDEQATAIDNAAAVQLFVERARRIRADFDLAAERSAVLQICRLVDGMPLALELAAAWVGTLPCTTIAAEIAHNLDLLTSRMRDVPDRHRSMRAAFNSSWQRLGEDEQRLFARMAIFQGGFTDAAARQVAQASWPMLASLVDKSLLRHTADGRYQIHELLRQFAAEQLELLGEDRHSLRQQHCAYYRQLVIRDGAAVLGGDQLGAAALLDADIENIRQAWQWILEQADSPAIRQMTQILAMYCQGRSRYREGATLMSQAVQLLSQQTDESSRDFLAVALVDLGFFEMRLGRLQAARQSFEQARDLLDSRGRVPMAGHSSDPLIGLGFLALIHGDYQEAERLAKAACNRPDPHPGNLPPAWYVRAQAALAAGDYATAHDAARRAYDYAAASQDRWFQAYCLNDLGILACLMENYAEAAGYAEESYAIRAAFADAEGMALAQALLARIALLQGQADEARQRYEDSLALYQDLGDRGGLANALHGLGMVACAQNACQDARSYLRQALQIATDVQFVTLELAILCSSGELLLKTGHRRRGGELLQLAAQHPAGDRETRRRAQQLLASAGLAASAHHKDLAAIVADLLTDFPAEAQLAAGTESRSATGVSHSELLDPLTARENDILQLIVAGHSNKAIAETLVMTVSTVKWYCSQIYSKLGVSSRTQAIVRAQELGLV